MFINQNYTILDYKQRFKGPNMFLKLLQIFLISLSCLIGFSSKGHSNTLSPQNFNTLYNLAAKGDLATINNAISRGLNIDAVNSSGDTGLCVAAKRRNRKAFRSYLQAGANPSHYCTWEIRGYREFFRDTITNPVKNLDEAAALKYKDNTPMSMKTKTLIGAGIVAAGAGVAIGLGGGGGGGSDGDPNCVYGSWVEGICVCKEGYAGEKCNTCDTANGYNHYGAKTCHKELACSSNGTQKGGKCVCDKGYAGELCTDCALGYGRPGNGSRECVRKAKKDVIGNSLNSNYNTTGSISVNNDQYTDVYGLFYDSDKTPHSYELDKENFANLYSGIKASKVTHEVKYIDEEGKEQVEEVDVDYLVIDEYASIEVNNEGDGMVAGLYSNNAEKIYNNYLEIKDSGVITGELPSPSSPPYTTTPAFSDAYLLVTNVGDGIVYGIYGDKEVYSGDFKEDGAEDESSNVYMTSSIGVTNQGNGNAYGLYNPSEDGKVYNLTKTGQYISLSSTTGVRNISGKGNTYGLWALGEIENSGNVISYADEGDAYGLYTKVGTIKSANEDKVVSASPAVDVKSNTGTAYGMYVEGGKVENGLIISAVTTGGTNNAYGIYAKNKSTVTNTSGIIAESFGGDAYGIYNEGGTVVNSTQRYDIDVTAQNGTAYGIYSKGGEVENSGRIIVYGQDDSKSYGIYATNGAKVTNHGDFYFNINGAVLNPEISEDYCNANGCLTPGGGFAIYLTGGAKFVNKGTVESTSVLNLASGTMLGQDGQFKATALNGDLEVESDVVSGGFEDKYTVSGAINSDNVSGLNLSSESVLFEASLEGKDVVLNKKDFDEVVKNNKLASFLEQNYALKNNEELFKLVKSKSDVKELNSVLDNLTGKDVISRFADEDLMAQNELTFNINENLFKITDNTFSIASDVSSNVFNDRGSISRYALSGKKIGKMRMAVGLAVSDVKSDDNSNNRRDTRDFQFLMPFQWKNGSLNHIVTPKLAYSSGTYSRNGFDGMDYDGKIEKHMMGVSVQSKQSAKVLGFDFNPTYEANLLAYKTKLSEEAKQYSLTSEDETSYSATLGFGAYISKQHISQNHKFNFMMGAMLYHEFANPYETKLKMNGMKGNFVLRDEDRRNNYAVLRSSLSYDVNNVSVYGNLLSYVDSKARSKIDLGLKYYF